MLPDWVGKPTEKFPVGAIQMARWLKRYAAFGRRCRQRAGRLLDQMSTAETARDMDLAAGRARHTTDYLGVSSGTFARATYANLSPNLVRAMVVDGNLNPAAWASREQGAFPGGRWDLPSQVPCASARTAAAQDGEYLPSPLRPRVNPPLRVLGGQGHGHAGEVATLLARLRSNPLPWARSAPSPVLELWKAALGADGAPIVE